MQQHLVIALSRQFGSGGHAVGELVAQKLGLAFYDKALIERAANDASIDPKLLSALDDKLENGLLAGADDVRGIISRQRAFDVQADAVRAVAAEQDCVIVGRCADYLLEYSHNCHPIFICARLEDRVQRIMDKMDIPRKQAETLVRKMDKQRSSYYNMYTELRWGAPENYELCINTSRLGIEGAAEIVCRQIRGSE